MTRPRVIGLFAAVALLWASHARGIEQDLPDSPPAEETAVVHIENPEHPEHPQIEMPPFEIPSDWQSETVPYRLLTKEDFQAKSSHSLWGNIAHGAEICTHILPSDGPSPFHAVMRRDCSFWNKMIGPLGKAVTLTGLALGVPTVAPSKQPDWYILQHEQIHFAIMEVASRQLNATLRRLAERFSGPDLVARAYELTQQRVDLRHQEFDGETSGQYDPDSLERWVRVLEHQLGELCAEGEECRVRTTD